jgi:hypothetical protein
LARNVGICFICDNPTAPDNVKGYTIPLALRGFGTRYITQTQWGSIALYWDIFHAFLVLFVLVLIVRLSAEAYKGFMQGWRSDTNHKG